MQFSNQLQTEQHVQPIRTQRFFPPGSCAGSARAFLSPPPRYLNLLILIFPARNHRPNTDTEHSSKNPRPVLITFQNKGEKKEKHRLNNNNDDNIGEVKGKFSGGTSEINTHISHSLWNVSYSAQTPLSYCVLKSENNQNHQIKWVVILYRGEKTLRSSFTN